MIRHKSIAIVQGKMQKYGPKYGSYTGIYIKHIHKFLESKWGQRPKGISANPRFGPFKFNIPLLALIYFVIFD